MGMVEVGLFYTFESPVVAQGVLVRHTLELSEKKKKTHALELFHHVKSFASNLFTNV